MGTPKKISRQTTTSDSFTTLNEQNGEI